MPAGSPEPVYAEYTEHYPPDTAACNIWLSRRQPKLWRDRAEVAVTGKVELEDARARLLAKFDQVAERLMIDVTPDSVDATE